MNIQYNIYYGEKITQNVWTHSSNITAGKKKTQMFTIESSYSSYNELYRTMESLLS